MPKIRKKSPIHENADADITCDFGDGVISRFTNRLPHGNIVSSIIVRWSFLVVVLQLIKNSANKSQLDMLFEGCKKESHVFEDVRQRESFCQLVQQLRNHHSERKQIDQLSVFVGTWNMGTIATYILFLIITF